MKMKMGLKMAARGWSYHLLALLICLLFISGMTGTIIGMVLNVLLLLGILVMALNDGAYNGEKACTLEASLEKQAKEGRSIDEKLRKQVYDKRVAAWALIIGMLPMLLMATVNLIAAPFYPEEELVETVVEEEATFQFDYGDEQDGEEMSPINGFKVAARVVFMPYVCAYSLVSNETLNWMFLLFSLPIPLTQCIGYLLGPKLRIKKLREIALGKKRKMRNLKVNKKPRKPKAEV